MDELLGEDRAFDGGDNDFKYILDSDVFHNVPITDHMDGMPSSSYYEYDHLFDDDPLLSSDKMAAVHGDEPTSPAPPHITSEHSYSLTSQPSSPLTPDINIKQEDDLDSLSGDGMDGMDGMDDMLPVSPENDYHLPLLSDQGSSHGYFLTSDIVTGAKSILTTSGRAAQPQPTSLATTTLQQKQEGTKIKLELVTTMLAVDGLDSKHHLPPTPPGSTASDSDGSESPQRSVPSSPRAMPIQPAKRSICHRTDAPQLFTNIQKLPQSGPLILTEEEKRTLRQEGYPIPTKLPLTKAEEKSLKKVRRKIKNKISAQESRRKKKEYLEALEKRMDSYNNENSELRRKVETLETTNQSLLSQLTKLQSIVNKISKPIKDSTQTGTCLMVLVLCFAVFLGSWTPHSFMNSGSHLPKLFSSPLSSPSDQMPAHPYFGSYDNDQYSSSSLRAHDDDDNNNDMTDAIYGLYGPKPDSDSTDEDPYATYSMRSSRTLLSYRDEDIPVEYQNHDNADPSLGDVAPEVPPLPPAAKLAAAAMMGGQGSNVANFESEDNNLEAYMMMHPDMEAKIIPVDTMALINRSSNK